MKQIGIWVVIVLLAVACQPSAQSTKTEAEKTEPVAAVETETISYPADSVSADGMISFHGLRIDAAEATPLSDLAAMVAEKGTISPIKIEGEVLAACQAKGCWMTMPIAEGQEMRVKFKDYGFFVPKDIAGKTAILEGKAFADTTSVADLRHYAVDGGMSEEEAAEKFTEPEVAIAFEATGVIIKSEE
ncbi:MAG: DUF4920 domain-containing protein [Bacteroidota bacterium]